MSQTSLKTNMLKTAKSKVRRGAKRASYDKQEILDILGNLRINPPASACG